MKHHLSKYILSLSILLLFNCKENDDFTEELDSLILNENVEVYEPGIFNGYTLFSPLGSSNTFLVNNEGFVVHKWESTTPALISYLKENGELVRALRQENTLFGSGSTGAIEILNFEGDQTWLWEYNSPDYVLHHDLEILPNGNILAIVWEKKSEAEAISKGRNPSLLFENNVWPCKIIEIEVLANNEANIVWEWSVWDHLIQDFDSTKENFAVINQHPELININYSGGDANFNHLNSVEYIEEFNQILISSRNFNELWIIDHSTTTAQASTSLGGNSNKGGDLLYRWGNPAAFDVGTTDDQSLFGQHDVSWVDNTPNNGGNILVFNNNKFTSKSSVDEINIPQQSNGAFNLPGNTIHSPETFSWSYESETIFSTRLSGAKRLPNGNTLITNGRQGTLFEIDPMGNLLWQYQNTIENNISIFKADKYDVNHPAFQGRNLIPLNIEIE